MFFSDDAPLPPPESLPLEHSIPVMLDEPPSKKHKDEDEYYNDLYFSCADDIHTKDQRLINHLANQSKLIEEGLKQFQDSIKQTLKPNALFGQYDKYSHTWSKQEAHFVFPEPWRNDCCFYIDLCTGEAFRVDTATDNLTEEQVHEHWTLVEEADRKEISNLSIAESGKLNWHPNTISHLLMLCGFANGSVSPTEL